MLKSIGSDPANWEGEYIRFSYINNEDDPNRKTDIWEVVAKKDGALLGEVKWFGRWRKYSFFAAPECIFEEVCLGDIADFLRWATDAEKHGV